MVNYCCDHSQAVRLSILSAAFGGRLGPCGVLCIAMLTGGLCGSQACGQYSIGSAPREARRYGGWQSAASSAEPIRRDSSPPILSSASTREERGQGGDWPVVQRALYRPQSGSLPKLPPLPSGASRSSTEGQGEAAENSPRERRLSDAVTLPAYPAPTGRPDGEQLDQYQDREPARTAVTTASAPLQQPEVLPPSSTNSNRSQNSGAQQNELRDIDRTQPGSRMNSGRSLPDHSELANSPGGYSQSIATGLPYVTPPPASRGRYPTSPYSASFYRNASYQMVSGSNSKLRAHTAAAQQPAAGQENASRAGLPQYQRPDYQRPDYQRPGIYPTAYQQCQPPQATYPPPGQVPGNYVPPTLTPNLAPGVYSSNNSGFRPLFTLGQENYNVQLGRGVIGQPTAYVSGQPVRNFLRYLSP